MKEKIEIMDQLLDEVANMQYPSIAEILRSKGYTYEASKVEGLVNAYLKITNRNEFIAAIN